MRQDATLSYENCAHPNVDLRSARQNLLTLFTDEVAKPETVQVCSKEFFVSFYIFHLTIFILHCHLTFFSLSNFILNVE